MPLKEQDSLNSFDRTDISESVDANTVEVNIELAGVKRSDVTIDVHDERLVVSGEVIRPSPTAGKGDYTLQERKSGRFSRTVFLPKGTKVSNRFVGREIVTSS